MRKLPAPKKLRSAPKPSAKHRKPPKPSKGRTGRENILSHEYSPETGHLTVTFHGGRRYRYEGVRKEDAEAFASAESKGKHLRSHIIGKYDHSRLDDS